MPQIIEASEKFLTYKGDTQTAIFWSSPSAKHTAAPTCPRC